MPTLSCVVELIQANSRLHSRKAAFQTRSKRRRVKAMSRGPAIAMVQASHWGCQSGAEVQCSTAMSSADGSKEKAPIQERALRVALSCTVRRPSR